MWISQLGPSKEQLWSFFFVVLGAVAVYWLIDSKVMELNQEWAKQAEEQAQKHDLVEQFTLLGQSRIYFAEVYYLNKQSGESAEVLDTSWTDYKDAVAEWNRHNLLNPILIEHFYSTGFKERYHDRLLPKLTALHDGLLALRSDQEVEEFSETLEAAKREMIIISEVLMFGVEYNAK